MTEPFAPGTRIAVIGSGPGAVAAIWRLMESGIRPVVLDAGEQLPEREQTLVKELRGSYGAWNPETVEAVSRNPSATGKSIPKKLVFGSDFLHGNARLHSPLANLSYIAPTFAMGGYTVGWGGAMLPITAPDADDWPFSVRDLDAGFRNVLKRIPFSAADDDLSSKFPLFGSNPVPLALSPQSTDVLRRLRSHSGSAAGGEWVCGQARIAIDSPSCRRCGMCLSGCPFGVIQTMDGAVQKLSESGDIEYRPGTIVTSLREQDGIVQVEWVDPAGRPQAPQSFDRVFLAAGAIGSTRIAMESLGYFEQPVSMLDSQKFAVPILVSTPDASNPAQKVTLPSIFLDTRAPGPGGHWVHLQISPFNPYAQQMLSKRLQWGPLKLGGAVGALTRHVMIGWGGLHSSLSSGFRLTLLRAHQRGRPILKIEDSIKKDSLAHVRSALKHLSRGMRTRRLLLLRWASLVGSPGAGFHFGGTMPMRKVRAHRLDTDSLGRLECWDRVHIVDSSVLPSIPATTLVLTIMANSWRIVSETIHADRQTG